jgi:hypothetical protein
MKAMGLPEGRHKLGELDVLVVAVREGDAGGSHGYQGTHAVLAGTSTL